MKSHSIALCLVLGAILSSLLVFAFGSGGIAGYRELEGYQEVLANNIQDLKRINRSLLEQLESLRSDPESILLQARELGYFREGERVIKIEGYRPGAGYTTVGKIIRRGPEGKDRDWIFKLAGFCLPLAFLFFRRLLFFKKASRR